MLAGLTGLTEKMDAFGKRMDALEKKEPAEKKEDRKDSVLTNQQRADAERQRQTDLSEAQMRAERAYQCFGRRADAPMQSEGAMAYRKRLVRGMVLHSPIFKDADLDVLVSDTKLFEKAEQQIYADAAEAAKRGPTDGRQEKRVTIDPETGHRVTTFLGGDTIFKRLAQPSKRVTGIFTARGADAR